MKVVIVNSFRDVYNPDVVYRVGEEHEFDDARALNLLSFGHVEIVSAVSEEEENADSEENAYSEDNAYSEEKAQRPRRTRRSSAKNEE